jgi:hypothetical protein
MAYEGAPPDLTKAAECLPRRLGRALHQGELRDRTRVRGYLPLCSVAGALPSRVEVGLSRHALRGVENKMGGI